jgi:hypothetical protein
MSQEMSETPRARGDGYCLAKGAQMDEPAESLNFPGDKQSPSPGRARGRKGRSHRPAGESHAKGNLFPVTVQVPREVLASYDRFAAVSGVNRQHLMREALAMYALVLKGNARVQLPVVARFVDEEAA